MVPVDEKFAVETLESILMNINSYGIKVYDE